MDQCSSVKTLYHEASGNYYTRLKMRGTYLNG